MLPTIGIMIGCYIVTRMLSFMTRKGERKESALTQVFAVITFFATLIIMAGLFLTGATGLQSN